MVMTMNISIVGNSNCVFAKGFTLGVKECASKYGGSVGNYSLGGSCCAFHIYTFHEKYSELSNSDVVFIDSLIIDTFHLKRKIINQDELFSLIDDMYALYSQLPGKVVSVLFPIEMHTSNFEYLPTYKVHKDCAKKYGIDVLDLYKMIPGGREDYGWLFMQPSHIKLEVASEIGYNLTSICLEENSGMKEAELPITPYLVVKGSEFDGLEAVCVESSYYSETCYKLNKGVSLNKYSGKSLVGALHWNKQSVSKFVCLSGSEHDVIPFRSQYAFFEVLNSRRKINKGLTIRPGGYEEKVTQNTAGNSYSGDFDVPHFAGLLLRDESDVGSFAVGVNSELNDYMKMSLG